MVHRDKKGFKVAFLQAGDIPFIGIMSLSAVLKDHGFTTDVFSIDLEDDVVESILKYDPDIIGASVMTTTFKTMINIISRVKKRKQDAFTIMGGPHVTFFPQFFYQEKDLDAVCVGEGEYPLLELALSIKEGAINTDIKNLWIRQNGNVIKNDMRELISDLDSLPFPDRDVFFERYPFMAQRTIRFMTCRGCPFNCSYCLNKGMKDLYKGKGSWLRFKSIERSVEEIKEVNKKYPIKWVSFMDDTFNTNKKRLREFLEMYKREIGIPFICQMRVDFADEEQIKLLKDAGVDRITIGVEHGDEDFRRKVLNRDVTNKQILDFGKWVNEANIRLSTQNIIGFPGETLDLAFSTIEINAKIKPEFADSSILNPYPGTEIYNFSKENGYLSDYFDFHDLGSHSNSYYDSNHSVKSSINNKDIHKLLNLRCFFMLLVMYPWLKPVVKILIRFPYNRVYEFAWQITGNFRTIWRFADWSERKNILKKLVFVLVKG